MGSELSLERRSYVLFYYGRHHAIFFPGFRIFSVFGRRFVSCAITMIVILNMAMLTGNEGTKIWYGYDMLRTTSIFFAACLSCI
jgi:hypothetical protein